MMFLSSLSTLKKYSQSLLDTLSKPWFSYATIILLQLKVVWGMWQYQDLTPGDTSFYFKYAINWHSNFSINFVHHPLYIAFMGWFFTIGMNAYLIIILHRLVIIFAVSILVLAVMRILLPNGIAWIISAWWTILLINIQVLYEVHLFVVIFGGLALLVSSRGRNSVYRGATVSILLITSILVRNEYIIAFGIVSIICIIWEIYQIRQMQKFPIRRVLWSYIAPLIVAFVLIGFFLSTSVVKPPELWEKYEEKSALSFSQAIAHNYKLRNPTWVSNSWVNYSEVTMDKFGIPDVTFYQALKINPGEVFDYLFWNLRYPFIGLRSSLLNYSEDFQQYIFPESGIVSGLVLPFFLVSTVIAGISLLSQSHHRRQLHSLCETWFVWGVLLSNALVNMLVIIFNPNNPWQLGDYLHFLVLFTLALIGLSVWVLLSYLPRKLKIWKLLPILQIGILFIIPGYYIKQSAIDQQHWLLPLYQRLMPFEIILNDPSTVFLTNSYYSHDICNYIGLGHCTALDGSFLADQPADTLLDEYLNAYNVNLFYIDETLLDKLQNDHRAQTLLYYPEAVGWKIIAFEDSSNARWVLLWKKP